MALQSYKSQPEGKARYDYHAQEADVALDHVRYGEIKQGAQQYEKHESIDVRLVDLCHSNVGDQPYSQGYRELDNKFKWL